MICPGGVTPAREGPCRRGIPRPKCCAVTPRELETANRQPGSKPRRGCHVPAEPRCNPFPIRWRFSDFACRGRRHVRKSRTVATREMAGGADQRAGALVRSPHAPRHGCPTTYFGTPLANTFQHTAGLPDPTAIRRRKSPNPPQHSARAVRPAVSPLVPMPHRLAGPATIPHTPGVPGRPAAGRPSKSRDHPEHLPDPIKADPRGPAPRQSPSGRPPVPRRRRQPLR